LTVSNLTTPKDSPLKKILLALVSTAALVVALVPASPSQANTLTFTKKSCQAQGGTYATLSKNLRTCTTVAIVTDHVTPVTAESDQTFYSHIYYIGVSRRDNVTRETTTLTQRAHKQVSRTVTVEQISSTVVPISCTMVFADTGRRVDRNLSDCDAGSPFLDGIAPPTGLYVA
jgi:hypothetical protein